MANAKKCDRCGKLFEEVPEPSDVVILCKPPGRPVYPYLSYDLCYECLNSLEEWFKRKKG